MTEILRDIAGLCTEKERMIRVLVILTFDANIPIAFSSAVAISLSPFRTVVPLDQQRGVRRWFWKRTGLSYFV